MSYIHTQSQPAKPKQLKMQKGLEMNMKLCDHSAGNNPLTFSLSRGNLAFLCQKSGGILAPLDARTIQIQAAAAAAA